MSIYKIQCKTTDEFFIGRTCNSMGEAMKRWLHDYNKGKKSKVINYMKEKGGWDNFEFIVLEKVITEELRQKTQHYIDELKPSLNSSNLILNYERRLKREREYYERNKYQYTCECGKELFNTSKYYHDKKCPSKKVAG